MSHRPTPRFRGPELVGILLVALGVIFLLGNVGIFRVTWNLLWPSFIIVAGILVILSASRASSAPAETFRVARDGADWLVLELRMGAGRFRIGPGSDPSSLVAVEAGRGTIESRVTRDGGIARVTLQQDLRAWPWLRRSAGWDVAVSSAVATRLDLAAGAGELVLDLLGLAIADTRVSVGAADLKVRLPRPSGQVPVRLSVGAASVVVDVPAGVEARVETSGFLAVDGPRETPGFATARDRVAVRVEGAASSVRIRFGG